MNDIVLKPTLDDEGFAALDDSMKGLYRKEGDAHVFHVPDAAGVAAKNRELLAEVKAAKESIAALNEANNGLKGELTEAQNKPAPENAAELEAAWQKKYDSALKTKDGELQTLRNFAEEQTVGRMAVEIAGKLAAPGSESVILPHVQKRMRAEWVDGKPVVKILDANGAVSAATSDELMSEFRGDAAFAPILAKVNKSAGGGTAGTNTNGLPNGKTVDFASFRAMSQDARRSFLDDGGQIAN